MMDVSATEVVLDVVSAPVSEPAKPAPMKRKSTSRMQVSKMTSKAEAEMASQEPKTGLRAGFKVIGKLTGANTDIEAAVIKRLKEADVDGDGHLSSDEVMGIVKDLVLENRTKTRYGLISCAVTLLLIISLVANFFLSFTAVELSKETHAVSIPVFDGQASDARARLRALAQVEESEKEENKVAMTSKDGEMIVSTKEATETLPLWVTPVLPPAKLDQGTMEIKFEVYDYEHESKKTNTEETRRKRKRRKLADSEGDDSEVKTNLKSKTCVVAKAEQKSETHAVFTCQEGEEIEIVDGVTYFTTKEVNVGELITSPAFGGSKTSTAESTTNSVGMVDLGVEGTRRRRLSDATRSVTGAGWNSTVEETAPGPAGSTELKSYVTEPVANSKATLKQPVSGAPTITLSASRTDLKSELEELEAEAVDKLDKRGVDVEDKKASMRRRKLAVSLSGEDSPMEPPKSFEEASASPVLSVLEPAIAALAASNKEINDKKVLERCDEEENPACYRCRDSTLGCPSITIEHTGKLGEEEVTRTSRSRRLAGSAEVKTSKLMVSEKIGSDKGTHEEMFIADEGICGVKAKGDEHNKISAIAFRGCNASSYSGWYGIKGRALEQSLVANDPAKESKPAFVADEDEIEIDGEDEVEGEAVGRSEEEEEDGRRRKLYVRKDGLEGLSTEYTDDGKEPFVGFTASKGVALSSLSFTRKANYTRYAAVAKEDEMIKMGDGGEVYPAVLKSVEERRRRLESVGSERQLATLGTRLVGAVVTSDGMLESVSLVFKDDCASKIENLDAYTSCMERVRAVMCNAEGGETCTDKAASEEEIKAAADA